MENEEKEVKEEKTKKKSKKIWIIIIPLIVIICIAVAFFSIYMIYNGNELWGNNKTINDEEKEIGYISSLEKDDIIKLEDNSCKIVDSELLVTFSEDTPNEEAKSVIEKYNGKIVGELYFLNQYQVKFEETGEEALKAKKENLKTEANVENVIYNYVNEKEVEYNEQEENTVNEEAQLDRDYHISELEIDKAYKQVEAEEKINVGIIDTPIYYTHEDLSIDKDNIYFLSSNDFKTIDDILSYYKSYNHENDIENNNHDEEECNYIALRSHGTHVAGIISAEHDNTGIDGVNDNVNLHYASSWYYFKDDDTDGRLGHAETTFSLAYALSSLIMSDSKVINMSIEHYLSDSTEEISEDNEVYLEYKEYFENFFDKIEDTNKDFLIVKSAGDDSTDKELDIITKVFKEKEFANNHMIVVGTAQKPSMLDLEKEGITETYNVLYNKTTYSNYGEYVDILALGNIYSTIYDDDYGWMEGTSQAASVVTGIASLVYQSNPDLVANEVKEILINSANDFVAYNEDAIGVVNAENAVNEATDFDGELQERDEIGLIKGTIKNSKNEIVKQNVLICFKNTKTNETIYTVIEKGNYEAFIPTGTYNIEARIDGNLRFEKKDVKIDRLNPTTCNIILNLGSRYEIVNESGLTWEEAKEKCEKAGGHLVTITSQEEMDYIYETLNLGNGRYWIGAYRDEDFNWMWVTGEDWDYTNWDEGEPNDSSNVRSNENRVATWTQGKWNDLNEENTSEQRGYICEWE